MIGICALSLTVTRLNQKNEEEDKESLSIRRKLKKMYKIMNTIEVILILSLFPFNKAQQSI
jgi:hypothetical protein